MTQQGFKPWRLLFYWLLDSTIINTFCLSEYQRKAKLGPKVYSTAQYQVTKPVFGTIDNWKAAWGTLHSTVVPTTLVSI